MKLAYISGSDTIPAAWLGALNGENSDDIIQRQDVDQLRGLSCDAVVIRLPLDGCHAEDLLEQIQRVHPGLPVIIQDPQGTPADAVRLIKLAPSTSSRMTTKTNSARCWSGLPNMGVPVNLPHAHLAASPSRGVSFWSAKAWPCSRSWR